MTSVPKLMTKISAFAVYARNSQKRSLDSEAEEILKKEAKKEQVKAKELESHCPVVDEGVKPKSIVRASKKKKSKKVNNENIVPVNDNIEEEASNMEKEPLEIAEAFTNGHNEPVMIQSSVSLFSPTDARHPISPSKKKQITTAVSHSDETFIWLVSPYNGDFFYNEIYEKQPYHFKRSNPTYYKGLFSSKEFDQIVKENRLNCGVEIDVLSYINGTRTPVSNDVPVNSTFIWNSYHEGNSIRMRNPQAYHKPLWKLCALLQEHFASSVGVNMYLTPANTQGFPPHYDDIDAFVLQVEGKKLWKIYKPIRDGATEEIKIFIAYKLNYLSKLHITCNRKITESEFLARHSSGDFNESEIGDPCMEIELAAGDMLYFPRGFIHQAKAAEDTHSLHLTLSTNQLNTWGDFLQSGLSQALEVAMESNVEFRKSLPKHYLDCAGSTHYDRNSPHSRAFVKKAIDMAKETLDYFSVDQATDTHAIDFLNSCMPPVYSKGEKECSAHGNGPRFEKGVVMKVEPLTCESKIRLIRRRAFRLVVDDEGNRLFYTICNNKEHREDGAFFLDVHTDLVPAVTALFKNYPRFTKIKNLPGGDEDTKVSLVQQLYDRGFLMTPIPLPLLTNS